MLITWYISTCITISIIIYHIKRKGVVGGACNLQFQDYKPPISAPQSVMSDMGPRRYFLVFLSAYANIFVHFMRFCAFEGQLLDWQKPKLGIQ